jgi:hypothetical protein
MKYTLEQRVFMLEKYIKHKSFQEFCVAFVQKYPDVKLPRKSVVRRLVAKFRETGSLLDETDEVQTKGVVWNKLHTIPNTRRPLTAKRKSGGPAARKRDIYVSLRWTVTLSFPLLGEYKVDFLLSVRKRIIVV